MEAEKKPRKVMGVLQLIVAVACMWVAAVAFKSGWYILGTFDVFLVVLNARFAMYNFGWTKE